MAAKKKLAWDVNENGCWICTSHAPGGSGYPRLRDNGKDDKAHRIIYRKYKGEIPKGYDVCHKCDIRVCINPDHLFAGTRKENIQDCVNKGRNSRGENRPLAKLTKEQVIYIKDSIGKITGRECAKIYNVSPQQISRIRNGAEWAWV